MGEHIPCLLRAVALLLDYRLSSTSNRVNVNLPALLYRGAAKQVFIMSKASQLWSQVVTLLVSFSFIAPLAAAPAAKLKTPSERWGNFEKAEDVSFRRHIIPMFSRTGCNGRECHGAFAGQGGFQLSLFGYDFEKDHKEITNDQEEGVRMDKENIAQSLIIMKATNQEKHKGKERFAKDSWEYNMLLKWLKNGAKLDVEETGEFSHLEVTPKEIVFKKTGEAVQLKVLAHWKDGTVEDVTQITRFRTNDESVSDISATGEVKSIGPGDTHVVAFYDNGVLPIPVMLPVSDQTGSKFPKVATRTKIDELVVAKLRKVGIVPSEVCTDTEFLRRASLDVTGTLPTPEEVKQFLADTSPNKRQAKIDELLSRPGYAAWWTTKLNDFTGNNAKNLRSGNNVFPGEFSQQWYEWIYERVVNNRPYDELVAGIVLATSRSKPEQSYEEYAKAQSAFFKKEGAEDFTKRETMPYYWARTNIRKPEEKALAFSHSFLGVRIECAQCHKHPFDQWTKTDFEQFQAFFEPIRYGAPADKDEKGIQKKMTDDLRAAVGVGEKRTGADQRKIEAEFKRRAQAGEPVPWEEVYVNKVPERKLNEKQIAAIKKKNPNFSSRVLTPKILGGDEVMTSQYPDARQPLMEWLRGKDNPYFARSFVNRVWANYFGRGIVDPPDDMNLANPPVNEELMTYLADGFVAKGYDMKWLHREILSSDTYQRSWKTNPTNKLDEKNFSHAVMRRLPAEVAMDAIIMASAPSQQVAAYPIDMKARHIGPGANSYAKAARGGDYALKTFGKPVRETNCDCERTSDPTLLQTLFTRNDPELLTLLETKNSKNPAWIDELRRKYGGDASSVEKLVVALKRAEETEAKMLKTPPKEPTGDDAEARKKYEKHVAKLKDIVEQKQKLQAQIADKTPKADLTKDMDKLIEETFLRTVSRPPSQTEVAQARKDIATAADPINGVRDLLWAMLNTREFMVNH